MKSLCFILPANFVDDHELINHNKDEGLKAKQFSQIHSKTPIWRSLRQSLYRFLEWKWTSSCHKKHPTFVFHDTEGVQFLEKIGSDNPRIFSYAELFVGSNGFDKDQVLGSGGFGKVYRAKLPSDGTVVAVKCLMESGKSIEKTFAAELAAVANLRHRNLVRLRGWCVHDDQLLLVYDYMPNRSLDRLIFKQKGSSNSGEAVLSWERRKKIATGLAAALFYLHEQLETQIIHRDVKASNVMLDSNFSARLGDFGLARWLEHDIKYESTPSMRNQPFRLDETSKIGGTIGYLPPESFQKRAIFTAKSDVFSFGIVVLEIASGRRAVDLTYPDEQIILLDWIRRLSDEKSLFQASDARLPVGSYKLPEIERLIHVGLICTSHDPQSRPPVKWVLDALSDNNLCKLPDLPVFKSHPLYISLSSSPTSNNGSSITTGKYTFTNSSTPTAFDSSNLVTANDQTLFQTASDATATTTQGKYNRNQHYKVPNIETPREISYNEILLATNKFSDSNRIAEIDFGTAYHGILENSHHVIIKRLGLPNCPVLRMRFSNELKSMAQLRHRNLVQLRGWCTQHGEMLVVYDYSPGNLLSHILFHSDHKSRGRKLQWNQRYSIIKSLASAIYYLHEEWDEQVIHKNITSSAIYLDPDMNPRLGSFSLAEFLSRNEQGHNKVEPRNRSARGIFGHMAPEYMKSGESSAMADVYSFGIVLLEVATGQMAVDFRVPEGLLVKKVHRFETQKKPLQELADCRLDGQYDEKELMRVMKLGIECTRSNPEARPSMKQIVNILDGYDKCFIKNGQNRESRREWRQKNASSLSLVRGMQALGIQ